MHRTIKFLIVCAMLPLGISMTGCGRHVVQWPNLKQLDILAERCEALCDQGDLAGLRQIAGETKTAAAAVARDPVPANARQPDEVKALQGDLQSLVDSIQNPAQQNGADLVAALAAVHPIVEKLMEAAGIPHVHEAEKPSAAPAKDKKS